MNDALAEALHLASKPIQHPARSAAETRVAGGFDFGHGLLKSSGSGRTDTLPINVPSGAYVLPADIVSGLGQGNTFAGSKILDRVFTDMNAPREHHASGGRTEKHGNVPIIAAGGEYVVHPDVVRHIGGGDMKAGHEFLDQFVKDVRKRTQKTLAKLPGPAK